MGNKKDFHETSFDKASLLKLDILKDYLTEWLPVFLHNPHVEHIFIYDWFCGPGRDVKGHDGSPCIIYNVINKYSSSIGEKKIFVWLNDIDSNKVESCTRITPPSNVSVHYTSSDYKDCFDSFKQSTPRASAHFLFIDPKGLVDYEGLFSTVSKLPRTDFLLFLPSTHISRLYQEDSFAKHLPNFPPGVHPKDATKAICQYFKQEFSTEQKRIHLAPFALKKDQGGGINGLIFASKDLLGLDKFLRVVWNKSENGEANYTLKGDVDTTHGQATLLDEFSVPQKIKAFQDELRTKIIKKAFLTNYDVYKFALFFGVPAKNAKPVLTELKKKGILRSVPGLSYDTAVKKNSPIEYA